MLKTASNYINSIGALVFQGTWDAATNTPTLTSGVGNKGDYYVVSVAGNTNLDGITDWQLGDYAVFNGAVWQKVDNTDLVISVNGQTGAVNLTAVDVGATPNTAYVIASGLLSGGGQLTGNVTVDLTNVPIANVTGGVANTVNVIAGTGLNGGGALTGNVTLNLANTAVTAGTYGDSGNVSQITVDAQGRITSAANVVITATSVNGLGTMAYQNANNVMITGGYAVGLSNVETDKVVFDLTAGVTPTVGELAWANDDRLKTLSLGMANGDIQYIGQEQYFRIKASSAITKGQVVMFSGTLGASGGLQGAPATGLQPDQANYILGIAKDTLNTNDWGNVQYFGEVKGIDTTGGAENWVQGQILYYNPSVTGGLTKTKPNTPNAIAVIAAVVHVSNSNGILFVRPTFGSVLGGTDGNVQFGSLANNDFVVYNSANTRWENYSNVAARTALGLGTIATQNANSVVITGGTINNATLNNVVVASANITSNNVNFTGTTSANATFATSSLPLVPEGYITIYIGGVAKKMPYYGV